MPSKGKREERIVIPNLPEDATPFERLEIFTQRLLAVPKKEIDDKMAEEAEKQKEQRRTAKP